MRKWISVEERLPGICEAVIVFRVDGTIGEGYLYADGKWNYPMGGYGPKATHWMPLPEPPKEE